MPLVLVLLAGAVLWYAHAESWDLGGRSPILSYDSAQLALAGRELAWHGRLATPFALPIDLASHAAPPWPLSSVQPGLVLVEAAIFKLLPARGVVAGSDPRAWLTLVVPFVCYLLLGALAVLATSYVLARRFGDAPHWMRVGAPAALGLGVLLDVQVQHFSLSGVGELPFTALLLLSLLGLALGAASEVPLTLGVFLGVATLFRANAPWLAPAFALAAVWVAPPGRRLRTGSLVLAGYAALLAPWWIYKWRAFGSPAWDVARLELWDRVGDLSAFELLHRAERPGLPHGAHAIALLAAKSWANLGRLVPALLSGPRGLWFGALACWPLTQRGREDPAARPLAAAVLVLLVGLACDTLAAAAGTPLLRAAFPTRVLAELAGTLALWSLLRRAPGLSERTRSIACIAAALLALGWGTWTTRLAHVESRGGSLEQGRAVEPDTHVAFGHVRRIARAGRDRDEQPGARPRVADAPSGHPPRVLARRCGRVPCAARLPARAACLPQQRARVGAVAGDRGAPGRGGDARGAGRATRAAVRDAGRLHRGVARVRATPAAGRHAAALKPGPAGMGNQGHTPTPAPTDLVSSLRPPSGGRR